MSDLNSEILNWVLVAKGDSEGHPFHGNQYATASEILSAADELEKKADNFEENNDYDDHDAHIKHATEMAKAHRELAEMINRRADGFDLEGQPDGAKMLRILAKSHLNAAERQEESSAEAKYLQSVTPYQGMYDDWAPRIGDDATRFANHSTKYYLSVEKGALPGHPFEGNQWTVSSNTSNPGGVSFGTATATKPSGGHGEAAAHLRSIAAEAKKYDWNSPKTNKRLKTDALGRQVNEHYGESKTSATRRHNYEIGGAAEELAQKIEGDTSKPLSQHLAEAHDQADQYRTTANFHSMVDNYSTARHLREAAQTLDDLADSVAANVNVAKGAQVGHPFEGNQWTSLGEKAKALGVVAKGLKTTSSPANIMAVANMHREIAEQHSVAAGQNEELPNLTSPDEIGRNRYDALRSQSATEMGNHDAASYLHNRAADFLETAAHLIAGGNPEAGANALKYAKDASKQAIEASQQPTSHPVGDPEFAQHEEKIMNADLAELGKAVFTKYGPPAPLPTKPDWRSWGSQRISDSKMSPEQHERLGDARLSQAQYLQKKERELRTAGRHDEANRVHKDATRSFEEASRRYGLAGNSEKQANAKKVLEQHTGSGSQMGHPFHGNQYTKSVSEIAKGGPGSGPRPHGGSPLYLNGRPMLDRTVSYGSTYKKTWGDRNNTPEALSEITAKDHASDWNQMPMTDTAAKIMEAEMRHPDTEKAILGKSEMTNDERSADAIPKWLVQSATPQDLDALTDNNFHSSVRYIESQRPDLLQKSIGEIAKNNQSGHPFYGNQYTGGNAGAHFDGFRPMDAQQTIAQIGKMNILGISGGRVNALKNSHGETVGINLPVSRGYGVNVLLHPDDTYTVQRTFTRSGVTKIKGQEEGVHAEEIGDTTYRAGMYVNVPFGAHNP